MKIKTTAMLVAGAFAGVLAGAANAAAPLQGAGASAIRGTAEALVVGYCSNAASLTRYVGTNTDVTRIICTSPTAASGLTGTVDFSYDSNGGSWRAFTVTNNATLATPANVQSAATTGCTGTGTTTIGGVTFTNNTGCPLIAATAAPSIGFTDVEPSLFFGNPANQPVGVTFPSAIGASSFAGPVLGVVFGVAASSALYSALQTDQGIAGVGGCVLGDLTTENCAPSISRAQYRSLVQASQGALQFDWTYLFNNAANVPANTVVNIARRDKGSGTQASSNAYFLGIGCTGRALADALEAQNTGTYVVTTNPSSGAVRTQLGSGSWAIGVLSRESNPNTSPAGWGFLKLNGFYPSRQNATTGKYDYFTEEHLYCKAGANADEAKLCTDIRNSTAAFVNAAGVFSLTQVFTGFPTSPASGTFYRNNANVCGAAFAF